MKSMLVSLGLCVLLALAGCGQPAGVEAEPATGRAEDSAAAPAAAGNAEAMQAWGRGAAYLVSIQKENGVFGEFAHPAVSALAVLAIHEAPMDEAKREQAIDRAMTYVLSFQQPEGSIYPADRDRGESANYPNYTTTTALLAMATLDRDEYLPIMKKARQYLQNLQFEDRARVDFGGIGYGKTQRADLSNASLAAEALYYTEYLDREPYADNPEAMAETEQMWKDFAVFLTKCQNLPDQNPQPYVSADPRDRGGFVYRPYESKAGTRDESEGASATGDNASDLVSSGSMTYAGLKSMLYAGLEKDDPRVQGAIGYLMRNYTLDENPGMGMQGLYYYLLAMTKALEAYGEPVLKDADGNRHDWRAEIIAKVVAMQNEDGSWANSVGRYFESSPALATSYGCIILKNATGNSGLRH